MWWDAKSPLAMTQAQRHDRARAQKTHTRMPKRCAKRSHQPSLFLNFPNLSESSPYASIMQSLDFALIHVPVMGFRSLCVYG